MSKQMNQYAVAFNEVAVKDDQGKPFDVATQTMAMAILVTNWIINQKIDFIGNIVANETPGITLNTTADSINKIRDAFKSEIASVQLVKENVITIPDPYKKKTRRPGFGE